MKQQKTGTRPASPMTGLCQRAALWLVWLISLGSPMLNSLLLQKPVKVYLCNWGTQKILLFHLTSSS
uniref:Glucuronic acid epimerase n=1 Tax=Rousettus aegyptiacus TaxID=9407 RepID=A0A7J8IJ52_ROUAE|nr:glucuronic acid epimerase [Rousettus aegyptiacus]